MKRFLYSPGGKAALLVLQQVLVGVMVLSVCFGTLMLMKGGDSLFAGQGKYEQSAQFDDAFMSGVYDTIWLTDYKYNFETDGVYNPKKNRGYRRLRAEWTDYRGSHAQHRLLPGGPGKLGQAGKRK